MKTKANQQRKSLDQVTSMAFARRRQTRELKDMKIEFADGNREITITDPHSQGGPSVRTYKCEYDPKLGLTVIERVDLHGRKQVIAIPVGEQRHECFWDFFVRDLALRCVELQKLAFEKEPEK